MSELKELIKQRATIRARLTLFEKYLTPLMDSKDTTKLKINELSVRLGKMRDLSCTFEEVQSQIELLEEDTTKQMQERESTENTYYNLIAQAQSLLDFFQEEIKVESSSNASCSGHSRLKLPPLKVPTFSGDSNKWLSFRDTYLSLIHNNDSIDEINKFHYLKSYLDGAASSVINSVTVSSNNYIIAWNLLCERYDNKRLLINEHIKCLFSIESLQRETDIGIRNLIDNLSKNLNALNSLGEPTDKWDTIIIYMASTKLDTVTARKWEEFRSVTDSPTLDEFYSFLRQRATVLETLNSSRSHHKVHYEKRHSLPRTKSFIASSLFSSLDSSPTKRCIFCNQNHKVHECFKFKSLPIDERNAKTSLFKLCKNCLCSGHQSYTCRLSGCKICHRRHNTLLHKNINIQETTHYENDKDKINKNNQSTKCENSNLPDPVNDSPVPGASTSVSMSAVSTNQALLSTALVKVTNNGKTFILRALLDCGSQSSFISERAQLKIGSCKRNDNYQCVSGLGNILLNVTEHCNVHIQSLHSKFNATLKCFVLPQITDNIPQTTLRIHDLGIPSNIQLADPKFYTSSEIDLLLGADIFWDILLANKIKLGAQRPVLQDTHLGWVVAGPMGGSYYEGPKLHCYFSRDIQTQLAKFWELEEVPPTSNHYDQNNCCERLFRETTYREDDGRFCVQIPLKESIETLGNSYNTAEKRFLQLERKLKNKPTLQQNYRNFIHEYQRLGHMTEISKPTFGYYLPHHAVLKESSETTKLRVVFDASAKTSTGVSLNDIQHIGPVVQDDLFSILLRYRQHKHVVSADVEKMYRQILVTPKQRILQLILWRDEPPQPIRIFQLNTVTYGTASAPYLSTRCLLQLSMDCEDTDISKLIKEDFYVDDFLSGAETEAELRNKIHSVTAILNSACLPLRKWRTNTPSIFQENLSTCLPKDLDLSSQSSVLGLRWDPVKDILLFPVNLHCDKTATKRSILSNSAKLFDPLGLLGPCTIIPKIMLQKLWLSKLDWDESLDPLLTKEWQKFTTDLNAVSKIEIPRFVLLSKPTSIELHSFSDASQVAYASAIYLRTTDMSGRIQVKLLCAKTKVAPVKPTTIPRLELSGALLSARLSAKVLRALRCKIESVFHWTDSTVVLCWLSSQACELKTFVSNRVSEIQELTASSVWKHVPGDKNPADLASRGLSPKLMQSATLWWNGPPFLAEDSRNWPQGAKSINIDEVPEKRTYSKSLATTTLQSNTLCTKPKSTFINFKNHSRYTFLLRSTAYVLRFIHNLQHKRDKLTNTLTAIELEKAQTLLIKLHQNECFSEEIKLLVSKQDLPSRSRLLSLSPFLDEHGILRVGGRIQKSDVTYKKIHPVLLDSNHDFTKLLVIYQHLKSLHCGPQLLLSELRNNFWPLRGRTLVRSTINNCKICKIMKAKCINPLMGNLPASRVVPSLPFQVSGVDFAGPFYITDRKGRGCKISKCYMCLFICFSTKALHLEVASDLTSDVFILCLRRFISRRGKPSEIYCDNGTNFVGASNEITQLLKSNSDNISGFASDEGIKFNFSPAYSPHFGGLWEAGVKSAKYHIRRILGVQHLTFEELSTLFSQIEAILNSRPITPLSSDPNDLNPLTPAHFLIGRPLTSLPTKSLLDVKSTTLSRYQHLESLRQHFWHRWTKEYLSELQQRKKWRTQQQGLKEGDLVVIMEANAPPLQWRMARVQRLIPGTDGISRVADILNNKGVIRRAVHNLCSLPNPVTSIPEGFEGGEDVHDGTGGSGAGDASAVRIGG